LTKKVSALKKALQSLLRIRVDEGDELRHKDPERRIDSARRKRYNENK